MGLCFWCGAGVHHMGRSIFLEKMIAGWNKKAFSGRPCLGGPTTRFLATTSAVPMSHVPVASTHCSEVWIKVPRLRSGGKRIVQSIIDLSDEASESCTHTHTHLGPPTHTVSSIHTPDTPTSTQHHGHGRPPQEREAAVPGPGRGRRYRVVLRPRVCACEGMGGRKGGCIPPIVPRADTHSPLPYLLTHRHARGGGRGLLGSGRCVCRGPHEPLVRRCMSRVPSNTHRSALTHVRPPTPPHPRRFHKSLGISGKVGTVMMAITGSFFLISEKVSQKDMPWWPPFFASASSVSLTLAHTTPRPGARGRPAAPGSVRI